jgi:NMD protein affecting ribosome stability and mRNA decay
VKPVRGTTRVYARDSQADAPRVVVHEEDPYRMTARPPDPTYCPTCHAVFTHGRWSWVRKPEDAHEQACPACQRVRDQFPAGYVLIKGEFLKGHRDEIVALVTSKEVLEKAEHPLQRIMAFEDVSDGLQVTTTDSQLARTIGEALQETFKGDLKFKYSRDENLLRATWKR